MRPARVFVALLFAVALTGYDSPQADSTVELKLQTAETRVFHLVLVELPSPQVSHCRGDKILTLELSGGQQRRQVVDVGHKGPGRTDSLVLCTPEDEVLKPLWGGPIRAKDGKRLIALDCRVGESLELDCEARSAMPSSKPAT